MKDNHAVLPLTETWGFIRQKIHVLIADIKKTYPDAEENIEMSETPLMFQIEAKGLPRAFVRASISPKGDFISTRTQVTRASGDPAQPTYTVCEERTIRVTSIDGQTVFVTEEGTHITTFTELVEQILQPILDCCCAVHC
jgi:hypothetical protein